jgi:hypothetical protein
MVDGDAVEAARYPTNVAGYASCIGTRRFGSMPWPCAYRFRRIEPFKTDVMVQLVCNGRVVGVCQAIVVLRVGSSLLLLMLRNSSVPLKRVRWLSVEHRS